MFCCFFLQNQELYFYLNHQNISHVICLTDVEQTEKSILSFFFNPGNN